MPFRDRWSLVAGDCVHNLRSALDHLVYAVAAGQSIGGKISNERNLQFPITASPDIFAKECWRIKTLSDAVRTAIEGVQPYNRPDRLLPPLLSLIQYFDNIDKHRLLHIALCKQQIGEGQIYFPDGYRITETSANAGDLIDGAEIMSFTIDPPLLNVKYKYDVSFTIGFRHPTGPTGIQVTGVRNLLGILCEEVKAVVGIISGKA